jgi:hypothetical protein
VIADASQQPLCYGRFVVLGTESCRNDHATGLYRSKPSG